MSQPETPSQVSTTTQAESYALRGNTAFDKVLVGRTATRDAAFFLPHLRPGMRLLDCGCGPGTITLGLAEVVAPGEVIGIDLEERQIEAARARAAEDGVTSVRFEVGDMYALPFPDAAFDAVFSNMVLFHLRDPLAALREMRRVLRPGGVVGLRDVDEGATLLAPSLPLVDKLQALQSRLLAHYGGDPCFGRHQRRLLLEAGFARAEAQVVAYGGGTAEAAGQYNRLLQARFFQGRGAAVALEQGWTSPETIEAMAAELAAWAQRPDAFWAGVNCAAVGWVEP